MNHTLNKIAASAAVFFVLAAPAKAASPPALCKVALDSLGSSSGAPGDSFEMLGVWEDTQGAKTASINKGSGRLLEVLSWSASVIKVRIPGDLSPGIYKVGVYCNNPPHWQGSGFKDFTVTAKAGDRHSPASQPLEGVEPPEGVQPRPSAPAALPPQSAALTAPEVQQTQPAQTGTGGQIQIQLREVTEKQTPPAPEQSGTGGVKKQDKLGLWMLAVIFAAVIVFIIRKRSVVRAANYQQAAGLPEEKPDVVKTKARIAAGRNLPKAFTGEYKGVAYSAETLGFNPDKDDPSAFGTPCVTVSIDAPKPLSRELEVNARKTRPAVSGDRAAHIDALLDMGADYIDVGFNTTWVAAEVPATKAVVDRALAERIVERLIKLRELSA
ncbi:MAG: hypothetical protein HZB82_09925 [Deltaproteobacteria bacterium]|nr:hypothetical protein [Deltaproteobacteria bacterium]